MTDMIVNPHDPKYSIAVSKLLTIMNELREQCPWDMKQTTESLRYLSIEEVFELSDAILEKDTIEIKKELGDLLLHIVFYSRIAAEKKDFDLADVIDQLCEKLVRRHPHIYGDLKGADEATVKKNWELIKLEENKDNPKRQGLLSGVPKSLPALTKSIRIQEKVRGVGFDWDNHTQVWEKVQEEMEEFQEEMRRCDFKPDDKAKKEFGDLIFSLVNYARFTGIDPDEALELTNKKFINRFNYLEDKTKELNLELKNMSLEEMDEIWEESKAFFQ